MWSYTQSSKARNVNHIEKENWMENMDSDLNTKPVDRLSKLKKDNSQIHGRNRIGV